MGYIRVQKANCKNCYKCLKHCAVKSIRYINDRVDVIEEACILCGRCVNVCPQKAKTVVNDPARVLDMLAAPGVRVVASLAPSYIGVYGEENRGRFYAALKKLGFDEVQETALGAHEVSLRYKELMEEGTMPSILGTCCPAVNELIVKYHPSLIPLMAPVVSPALAHGRMIKDRQGARNQGGFHRPLPRQNQGDRRSSRIGGRGDLFPDAGQPPRPARDPYGGAGAGRRAAARPLLPDLSHPRRGGTGRPPRGGSLGRPLRRIPLPQRVRP